MPFMVSGQWEGWFQTPAFERGPSHLVRPLNQ